jgi:hypothetical protein
LSHDAIDVLHVHGSYGQGFSGGGRQEVALKSVFVSGLAQGGPWCCQTGGNDDACQQAPVGMGFAFALDAYARTTM